MISFPNAKINLGLNVLRKRDDGFHDIETLMIPVGLCDVLEIMKSKTAESTFKCSGIKIGGGLPVPGNDESTDANGQHDNLVIKAYQLLKNDFELPPLYIHLHKAIPAGAGLGGGSSDCAFTLKMLNDIFNLNLNTEQLKAYAQRLGSDCAFFIENKSALSTGRGEILHPSPVTLTGYFLYLIKPDVHITTAEAYAWVKPDANAETLTTILKKPIAEWKHWLKNDFEEPVFRNHPELRNIKDAFYRHGALYASMSGSGSAIFGLFDHEPENIDFPGDFFCWKEWL
jgi:4-diphosphocytidyl-2-C-methyl-D-erythritol kinase